MSLIAQLSAAGITMSQECDGPRDTTPADAGMLLADVEFSQAILNSLPEYERNNVLEAQEFVNLTAAMEHLVDLHHEATSFRAQLSAEGMKNSAGLRLGTMRIAELRERVGFSNLWFSPESHEELTTSSEGFLQSVWDAIVKVAKAIKNFFKRLFGMQVDDEDAPGTSESVSPSAVDNMTKRLKDITTDKSVAVPKEVFEKSIMVLDTRDAGHLKDGVKKLEDMKQWLTERQRQITQLLNSAEGLTPVDMEAEFTAAVSSLKSNPENNSKSTHKDNQEVVKGGFMYGFSSGRSAHIFMGREGGKSELKFRAFFFEDKVDMLSDMTVSTPSVLAGVFEDYRRFQTDHIGFTKSFGDDVMKRQEKFEKWAEDHAKRNSDDAEKEQMSKLLASIRSTQGMLMEIASVFKAYRQAVGTFESTIMVIAGKYIKLVETGEGGAPAEKKDGPSDLPPIDESMIQEGSGDSVPGTRTEQREKQVATLKK